MDRILETEILLSSINTVFSKSVALKDAVAIQKLNKLRHQVYYTDCDFERIKTEVDKIRVVMVEK